MRVDSYQYGDERISLVARLAGSGGQKNRSALAGIPTWVPLGNKAWTVEPFAGDIVDGRIYGRGTCDMKGGVAAFVHMGLKLAAEPRGAADILLVMVAGEETGCDGSKHLEDLGVLPEAGAMVIAEPTSNYPILGHRGALWLNVTAHGKTAHGSMPQHGDNAVYKAARAVSKLEEFRLQCAAGQPAWVDDAQCRDFSRWHQHQLGTRPGEFHRRYPQHSGTPAR